MQILAEAGINPYFMQMVNIREQVAWVTPDPAEATQKATVAIRSAMARVCLQLPLEKQELGANGDVLVIGAGPAGLQSALFLAEAAAKSCWSKSPAIGECRCFSRNYFHYGMRPCLLEPFEEEVLHGTTHITSNCSCSSEVTGVTGYYGNFTPLIKADAAVCRGLRASVADVRRGLSSVGSNELKLRNEQKEAIAMPFLGAYLNFPYIDQRSCLRRRRRRTASSASTPVPCRIPCCWTTRSGSSSGKVGAIIDSGRIGKQALDLRSQAVARIRRYDDASHLALDDRLLSSSSTVCRHGTGVEAELAVAAAGAQAKSLIDVTES